MSRDRLIVGGKVLSASSRSECNLEVGELEDFISFEVRFDDGEVESFFLRKDKVEVLQKFLSSL